MAILASSKNPVLPEFQEYLLERKLVPEKNVPYFAHWVSRYLNFARKREIPSAVYHEIGILDFLEELRSDSRTADWQPRQADDAIQLYYFHFLGQKTPARCAPVQSKDIPGLHPGTVPILRLLFSLSVNLGQSPLAWFPGPIRKIIRQDYSFPSL